MPLTWLVQGCADAQVLAQAEVEGCAIQWGVVNDVLPDTVHSGDASWACVLDLVLKLMAEDNNSCSTVTKTRPGLRALRALGKGTNSAGSQRRALMGAAPSTGPYAAVDSGMPFLMVGWCAVSGQELTRSLEGKAQEAEERDCRLHDESGCFFLDESAMLQMRKRKQNSIM